MENHERSALAGIRQLVREIFRGRPTADDVVEFLEMEDHLLLTVTVKIWKEEEDKEN